MRKLGTATITMAMLVVSYALVPAASAQVAGDTEAPTAPTNLRVTDTTPNTVSIAWNPSTDDSGRLHYQIIQDNFYLVWDWYSGPSAVIHGLAPGATHTFAVRAVDQAGNRSTLSNTVTATTDPADTSPPTTPTGLRVTGTTTTSITLAWQPSTDNVGVLGYWIRSTTGPTRGTGATQFTYTGLTPGTTYRFSVSAYDAAYPTPNESPPSNEITATTDR